MIYTCFYLNRTLYYINNNTYPCVFITRARGRKTPKTQDEKDEKNSNSGSHLSCVYICIYITITLIIILVLFESSRKYQGAFPGRVAAVAAAVRKEEVSRQHPYMTCVSMCVRARATNSFYFSVGFDRRPFSDLIK